MALLILAGRGPLLECSWGLAGQLVPWDFLHTVSSSAAVPSFSLSSDGSGERMEVHEAPWSQGSKLTQPDFCQNQFSRAQELQLRKPPSLSPCAMREATAMGSPRSTTGSSPAHHNQRKASTATKTQHSQTNKKKNIKKLKEIASDLPLCNTWNKPEN